MASATTTKVKFQVVNAKGQPVALPPGPHQLRCKRIAPIGDGSVLVTFASLPARP